MPVVCSSNSQHPCDTQQISLPRGTTLSLICKYVEGTVTWSKNRGPLPADCQKSTISARCFTQNLRGEEVRKQRLTIRNITKRDEGNYTCKANNEESPLFLVIIKVSEDPTVLRNNTNKPTAFSGSPTDAQGTNWSSTAPPTETPERLNNCLLVHVYKEIAEELDLEAISRDFVRADDARKKHFGCF